MASSTSTSRSFVQKLPKSSANDIRRQTAAGLKSAEGSLLNPSVGRSYNSQFSHPGHHAPLTSTSSFGGEEYLVEPLDYEDYVVSQRPSLGDKDPLSHLMEFPSDDIEVSILPRKIRTMGHVVPEEPLEKLDPLVQNAVNCYTSDWVVTKRRYQHHSSSVQVQNYYEDVTTTYHNTLKQEFEVDETSDLLTPDEETDRNQKNQRRSWYNRSFTTNSRYQSQMSLQTPLLNLSRRDSVASLNDLDKFSEMSQTSLRRRYSCIDRNYKRISGSTLTLEHTDINVIIDDVDGDKTPTNECVPSRLDPAILMNALNKVSDFSIIRTDQDSGGETPTRQSWASFDLGAQVPDATIPGVFTPHRRDNKSSGFETNVPKGHRNKELFSLYPPQYDEELIERRLPAEVPSENIKHRILVQCNKLELNVKFEPFFASMALYDAKEKKKVSENFYFDMNNEDMRSMMVGHINKIDYTTQARSCVFGVSSNTSDLFLVVKLEKVLQGDINEAAEPYIKEQVVQKVKLNAAEACFKLGKYRMPFAWTAIWVPNIIKGKDFDKCNDSGGSDIECTSGSNSLERKASASFDQFRRGRDTSSSLERQAATNVSKRSSWSSSSAFGLNALNSVEESPSNSLDNFPPVTLTVSSFLKQEGDKLKDEDLYKLLQDLKRPSPALKRIKCIRGTLKLDISVAPEQTKYCLTPELAKIIPFYDTKTRPTKEILEFPARDVLQPNYQFRNLIYICPKDLNFTNRSGERARNIAIKIQFKAGEDESSSLHNIFGKSSGPEFVHEAYTAVTYHNKYPDFYEEVKVKLPSNLRDYHHIFFTFYHISCQGQRKEQESVDTPVGYSWIPIYKNGSLQTGLFELPVMIDHPPPRYSFISTDAAPPGTKWVDNKKLIFTIEVNACTTVHPVDQYLDPFCALTASLQLGTSDVPNNMKSNHCEEDLKYILNTLSASRLTPLVQFLPLVLDKLLLLMVKPSESSFDVGQAAFNSIASVVQKISSAVELQSENDRHGRNNLLTSYVHYQAHLPHPNLKPCKVTGRQKKPFMPPPGDMSLMADDEVGKIIGQSIGVPSIRNNNEVISSSPLNVKLVHEQIALQLSIASGKHRELALNCSWFFLELMIKAMIEHLATTSRLGSHRKNRFSDQFNDDVTNLVSSITSEIISRVQSNINLVEKINSCLAFFLHDLLSVMDRGFVFSLIKMYIKDTTHNRNSHNTSESINIWNLQLDFIRIVCSHEHFVTLNIPTRDPLLLPSRSVSPSPSVRSNDSQNSFVTFLSSSSKENTHWSDLTFEFKRQHFLVGLVLTQLSQALDQMSSEIHYRAVNTIRNLLSSHDLDSRYQEPEYRSRVASLYLPLVSIIIDNCHKLYAWVENGDSRIVGNGYGQNLNLNLILNVISSNLSHSKGPVPMVLKEETTRHLLICFLWVIKNIEGNTLKQWWSELSSPKLQILLELLRITISCFQYKGKKIIRKNASLGFRKSSDNVKSRLEDFIMGQGSARQDMIQRARRGDNRLPPSPNPDGNRRWHKSSFIKNSLQPSDSLPGNASPSAMSSSYYGGMNQCHINAYLADPEIHSHIEGNLSTETNNLVLDALEVIVQVVAQMDQSQGLLANVLKVLLHALGSNQSTSLLQRLFSVQRSFVFKFPSLLFDEASEHCADLCLRLLKHCSSSIGSVRSQSSASLYILMRQNFEIGNYFARIKMQVTMSLSQLVGTSSNFNEDFLRRSLKTILVYAEEDEEFSDTAFRKQVQGLVSNLHMILSDTVKMKEYQDDPEMLLDLMYRIAKGYQNSPDLRLTWLESMAKKHEEQNHFAEAGMCKIHCCALVSEYLHLLEDRKYMPTGAVTYSKITPNALEESAASDDLVSPDEEGICTGSKFTESGLMTMLDEAAKYLGQAGMYETVHGIYKVGIPIAEHNRNFKKMSEIYQDLHEAFKNIDRLQGRRIFATYFRVGFYGARLFGDLDKAEFVYKEKALAKLPEIAQRLEKFYGDKFGYDNLIIIKDSKNVETNDLIPEKAYIQITYVEPFFDNYELRDRVTVFEKNFNLSRFVFATPFTPDGSPHGELHEQYKRKTILTVENHFPYVKTRIRVRERKQFVLTPIEVAIEDIRKKTQELEVAVNQDPADPKILQMVLQGCIGTTVNQGPMEVANVFLKDLFEMNIVIHPTEFQNKLRLCFKDFSKKCRDALERNKKLITHDQKEYQKELQKNYATFERHLAPLFRDNGSMPQLPESNDVIETKVTSPMI
ncbi:dedicator of cytokinesis protein 7 isoform X1 [Lepeophtheirus salmonis]|nr:dedicator of cytokinesis protein 7-like isoform X2 [Lepeophtheirus salmonis]